MKKNDSANNLKFILEPIGRLERDGSLTCLRLGKEYRPALKELEGFSHAQILWWFDGFDTDEHRSMTQFDPPFEAPRLGVFASHAPFRSNPIALSTVKIIAVDETTGTVAIKKIDADEGSPVLDIKPYLPFYDRVESPRVPEWASRRPSWMPEDGVGLDDTP